MTQNRRIILNVVATYGRSLFSLVCGLFTGRWVLASLGQVDYGLLGLVGGLVAFVTFINSLLSAAVGRFYAYYVGAAKNDTLNGVEECRKWFNTALLIHVVVPTALLVIGYPLGEWTVLNFLTIPAERLESCVWLWRFSCLSCFVGMVNVPFQAMYTAKQEIAELTVYSIVATAANVCFGYYMITHPGDWLVRYGAWAMLVSVLPQVIIGIRACVAYPECRLRVNYLWSGDRVRQILSFSGGRFVCALSLLLCFNGSAIVVNKILGPIRNAALNIGGTIKSQCSTLTGSLTGAFAPAITNAAGAQDYARMRKYIVASCNGGVAALMVFTIPLLIELDYVITLWLKNPPDWSITITYWILVANIFEVMPNGLVSGIFAMGQIFKYQLYEAVCWVIVLPATYFFIKLGYDIVGYGLALLIAKLMATVVKLHFAHKACGIEVWPWVRNVCMKSLVIGALALLIGWIPRMYMDASFIRLIVVAIVAELVYLPLAWQFLAPEQLKTRVLLKMKRIMDFNLYE